MCAVGRGDDLSAVAGVLGDAAMDQSSGGVYQEDAGGYGGDLQAGDRGFLGEWGVEVFSFE